MANNLHVSYDLNAPGQNYARVIEKIKSLGGWAKIHKSYWYLSTHLTASEAAAEIWGVMDSTDSLYVVDATNDDAYWYNISDEVQQFIQKHWRNRWAA